MGRKLQRGHSELQLSVALHSGEHITVPLHDMNCSSQDLFLGVDGLSPVQWHPYSTVGGDQGHTLVAHIKAYGK